jgi:hypothetical protein
MAEDEKKKIGDINVSMGDQNTVAHIGHKIVFQEPPPDPNAIWQDQKPVGKIGSPPIAGNGTYSFAKLFLDGPFDSGREFSVQGVRLKIESHGAETSASFGGRPPLVTLWNVVCRIIK